MCNFANIPTKEAHTSFAFYRYCGEDKVDEKREIKILYSCHFASVIYKIHTHANRVGHHRHDPDGLLITCPMDTKLEICSIFCFRCLPWGQGRMSSHYLQSPSQTYRVSKGSGANLSPT